MDLKLLDKVASASVLIIGLTGGIGSGKSTAARYFSALGTPVIDADEIARELVIPGHSALNKIVAQFGPTILTRQGTLDRAALRRIVFAKPQQRQALEAILHPPIYQEMRRRISQLEAPYCILCIPLLVESPADSLVDRILVIDSTPDLQRQRTIARDGISAAEFAVIEHAQADRGQRLAAADEVITNNGSQTDLRRYVEKIHHKYLKLAAKHSEPEQKKPDKRL